MIPIPDLPIRQIIPELRAALAGKGAVILSAPPGSGKTTVVPLALLAEPWLKGRKIIMLEPRRLAARMAAGRMAESLGEPVGKTIGYQVRFEAKVSAGTRVEVVTEGILLRRLQGDQELQDTGLVIFDEFHERNLQSDLALAFCLDIQQTLRPDLKLLVMSATLDTAALSALFGNAPVIEAQGRIFPITVEYLPPGGQEYFRDPPPGKIAREAVAAVRRALAEQQGDTLVFLPGAGEIRQTATELANLAEAREVEVRPLFGDLPKIEQDRALLPSPQGRRKIVLATNIAETSLTIEGILTVVDTGWRRLSRFAPNTGLNRYETARISKAAAEQRAHRAGRLAPGHCYRLWSKALDQSLKPFALPEILEADLASLALEVAAWGSGDFRTLSWLTPPPASAYEHAKNLLISLEALDQHDRITEQGRRMAGVPLHPRLAHMILRAEELGLTDLACDLAALLSEREILSRGDTLRPADISVRLDILQRFRSQGRQAVARDGADPAACAQVEKNSLQLKKLFRARPGAADPEAAGLLLAFAFPDRIGQRRPDAPGSYLLSSGRAARLPEHDLLGNQPYLVAPLLDAGRVDGRIFLAAALTEETIRRHFAARIQTVAQVGWDDRLQAVRAERRETLQALTLSASALDPADPGAVTRAMVDGIRQLGLDSLPWEREALSLRDRVQFLRAQQPEAGWPDLSEAHLLETLEVWLAPYLGGISRRGQLRNLDLKKILQGLLPWEKQLLLDRLAPTHIEVPSGSRLRLSYPTGTPPVLAVRIQEMFGLAETPRVLDGRLPVVLHLLSPASRPMQVTRDLRSFWENIYPTVKKELQGRYPKHHWPSDPWSATPTARAKKRQR